MFQKTTLYSPVTAATHKMNFTHPPQKNSNNHAPTEQSENIKFVPNCLTRIISAINWKLNIFHQINDQKWNVFVIFDPIFCEKLVKWKNLKRNRLWKNCFDFRVENHHEDRTVRVLRVQDLPRPWENPHQGWWQELQVSNMRDYTGYDFCSWFCFVLL